MSIAWWVVHGVAAWDGWKLSRAGLRSAGPTSAAPASLRSSVRSSVLRPGVTLAHAAFSGGHARWGAWACRLTGIKHFAAGEAGLVPLLMALSGRGRGPASARPAGKPPPGSLLGNWLPGEDVPVSPAPPPTA